MLQSFSATVVCLLSAAAWCFAASAFSPKAVSPRRITIGAQPALVLMQQGEVNFEVIEPVNPAARQAAAELLAGLARITGKKITMVAEASGKVPAIYLGASSEAAKLGLLPEKLDRDGYYIKTDGDRLFIVGVDELPCLNQQTATLFGVYDFLERFAGARYYFPGDIGTIMPKKEDWSIPEIDIVERPDTQYRWIYCYPCSFADKERYDYPGQGNARNLKTWRNSSLNSIRSCHGLNDLQLATRFAKTNPEYFALGNDGIRHDGTNNKRSYHIHGHLCYSSPGLKEVVYQDAVACLTGKPASSRGISRWTPRWNTTHVNITPNDGVLWCQCPQCKPIQEQGKQAMSNHIWGFVIDIAEKLKQNGIPGMIVMDSYGVYSDMPTLEIPENIIVSLAVTGPWGEEHAKIREQGDRKLRDWSGLLKAKVGTWTYPTKACAEVPFVPNFTPRAVASFYKRQQPYIYGGFFEAGSDRWIFGFMNAYVYSKLLWDWNTDVEELLEEHCTLMFAAAAPYLASFYRELEELWMKNIVKETIATSWGESWQLPTRREVWTKIYSPEKIAAIRRLFETAEKAVADDAQALKRVQFMREEMWGPVLQGAEEYNREATDRTLWTLPGGQAADMVLDGQLSEEAWKKAKTAYLLPRSDNHKVEVHTRVKILRDSDYFHVGIEADEPHTDRMTASQRTNPDDSDIWRDNGIEVFLSASFDSDFIYQFIVNSVGAKSDLRNVVDRVDAGYDSQFEARTHIVPGKQWSVELRIPRQAMPELSGDALVGNFTRRRILQDITVQETGYIWRPWPRNIAENCGLIRWGEAPEKNLLKTGDFDRPMLRKRFIGDGEWGGDGEFRLDHEIFLTAGSSLCLEEKSNFVRQNIPVEPGHQYRLSFYIRTENLAPGMRAMVRFGGEPGGSFYVLGNYLDYIRGTTPWQRIEKVFTAPGRFGTDYQPHLEFAVGRKSSGKCWIDHVELCEITK